jgi:hypothetical protein
MSKPRPGRHLALLLACAVGLVATAPEADAAPAGDVVVVVHRENPVEELSQQILRRLYRGDQKRWPHGEPVTLLLPRPGTAPMQVVASRVLGLRSDAELAQYYMAAIFQQKIQHAPPTLAQRQAIAEVARNPGAVALVERKAVQPDAAVRVLSVEGL